MAANQAKEASSIQAIIGGLCLGLGAGLFFFPVSVFGTPSVFAFSGCIVGGFGIGLMVSGILSARG